MDDLGFRQRQRSVYCVSQVFLDERLWQHGGRMSAWDRGAADEKERDRFALKDSLDRGQATAFLQALVGDD